MIVDRGPRGKEGSQNGRRAARGKKGQSEGIPGIEPRIGRSRKAKKKKTKRPEQGDKGLWWLPVGSEKRAPLKPDSALTNPSSQDSNVALTSRGENVSEFRSRIAA